MEAPYYWLKPDKVANALTLLPSWDKSCRLAFLHIYNKLIEHRAPTVVEAHFLVSFAAFFFPVHGECRIFRAPGVRFKRNNRREHDCPAIDRVCG